MFGALDVPTAPCHAHFSGATVGVQRSTDFLCVLVALTRTQAERTQRMKIQWKSADGTTSEVEIDEEIGSYITASRREESNLARKERYHCYSLNAIDYEGLEYATDATPETEMETSERNKRLYNAMKTLTEVQRRRLLMLADGLSMREIARLEGVDHRAIRESIEAARKKFKKNF